jgi:threonine/homoserine/homoserine lactone efflux protein
MLPSAAAVALSPFPIIAVVVVLSAPRARRNGVAFAAGWLAGLTALTAVVVMVVGVAASEGEGSLAVAWVRVLVGAALLVLAVKKWRSRPAPGEEPEVPRWMASLDDLSARRSVGIGLALAGANPKNIALTAAAVASVGDPGWSDGERLLVVITYVALASVTVVGAVLAHLVAGERVGAALSALKAFMLRHNTFILVAVLVLLGVMIGGEGLRTVRG